MFCVPLLSSSNSSEQLSKASAWNSSVLGAPYRTLPQLLLQKKTAGPPSTEVPALPCPAHAVSGKEGIFVWITTSRAISSRGWPCAALNSDTRAAVTELPTVPKPLQLLELNKCPAKPTPVTWPALEPSWCPELSCPCLLRGMERSSVGSTMVWCLSLGWNTAEALQAQLSRHTKLHQENTELCEPSAAGVEVGLCSSCDSSVSSSRASHGGTTSFGMRH